MTRKNGKMSEIPAKTNIVKALYGRAARRKISFPLSALVFEAAETLFAVPVKDVAEAAQTVWTSPLPGGKGPLAGAINYRGTLIPAIDLREALSGERAVLNPDAYYVIVNAGCRKLAIAADEIGDVVKFESADAAGKEEFPVPAFVVCALKKGFTPVFLLDAAKTLNAGEFLALEEQLHALAAAAGKKK